MTDLLFSNIAQVFRHILDSKPLMARVIAEICWWTKPLFSATIPTPSKANSHVVAGVYSLWKLISPWQAILAGVQFVSRSTSHLPMAVATMQQPTPSMTLSKSESLSSNAATVEQLLSVSHLSKIIFLLSINRFSAETKASRATLTLATWMQLSSACSPTAMSSTHYYTWKSTTG